MVKLNKCKNSAKNCIKLNKSVHSNKWQKQQTACNFPAAGSNSDFSVPQVICSPVYSGQNCKNGKKLFEKREKMYYTSVENRFSPLQVDSCCPLMNENNLNLKHDKNGKKARNVARHNKLCLKNLDNSQNATVKEQKVNEKVDTLKDLNVSQSKYDLGLTGLSKKVQKMKEARNAKFNKKFCAQNKGFFGFVPLSPVPDRVPDNSRHHDFHYLDLHRKLKSDGRQKF